MGAFFSVSNWDDHNELLTEIQKGKVSCKKSSSDAKDISGADLSGAKDLSGADLSGADLSRANLSGADLSGASNKNKANNTKNVKVTDKPTLSNGDCFYSAIYRASKERREVFDRINKDLGLESPEEDAFITAFREKVAKEVEADKLPSSPETNTDVYNTLSTTSSTEPDNYKEMVKAYPSWFRDEFGPGKTFGERPDFLKRLASHVRTAQEWVSEIEVNIVKRILESLHIHLDITSVTGETAVNTNTKRNLKQGEDDVLYLVNHGEAHYTYLSFPIAGNSATNKPTNSKPAEANANAVTEDPKAEAEEPKAEAEEPNAKKQTGGRVLGTYKNRESSQRRTRKRRRATIKAN